MRNIVKQYNNEKKLSFHPYFNFSTEIIFVVLSLISLLSLFILPQYNIYQVKKFSLYIFSPIASFTTKVFCSPLTFGKNFVELLKTKNENYKLRKELAYYNLLKNNLMEIKKENERLKMLLNFTRENSEFKFLPAQVITRDFYNWYNTITIDKGVNYKVKENSVVVSILPSNDVAAVGRIIEVSANMSKVLLISDENSYVVGYTPDTGENGLIRGTGSNTLVLEYLPLDSKIFAGTVVYTSGTGGIFPRGIKIGKVIEIKKDVEKPFLIAYVEPFLKFNAIYEVMIIQK